MKHLKVKSIRSVIIGIFLVIFLSSYSFSYIYVNGAEGGFGDGRENVSSIGNAIVDGAGYFIESYDSTLKLMKKIEWQQKDGIIIDELFALLDNALDNMKLANASYQDLTKLAEVTPYNSLVIDSLKTFNYNDFKTTNGLNGEIMAEVKSYLGKGDVRGVFTKVLSDTADITLLLNNVKEKLQSGVFPPLAEIWQLNNAYSQSLLFGQYTAQVFSNL